MCRVCGYVCMRAGCVGVYHVGYVGVYVCVQGVWECMHVHAGCGGMYVSMYASRVRSVGVRAGCVGVWICMKVVQVWTQDVQVCRYACRV